MPVNMEPETYRHIMRNAGNDKAAGTRRNYRCQWRRFALFCDQEGHTPAPAKPVTVAHYLVTLADMGRKPTTLQAILAAIADGHKRRRLDDPTRDPIVRKTLAGIKQARKEAGKSGPRQARGLTAEHLKAIRETIFQPRNTSGGLMESEARARKRGLRNLAVISVMRDALLRQAESRDLRWSDISFTDDGGALVRVRHSKTSDNAASLYIRRTAAQALREITPEHPDPQARVFGLRRSETVAWIIQRETEAAGLGEGFSGHSCRVGMAQDLAAAGASLAAIMQAGRWKSAATLARYIEHLQAQRGAVANLPEGE